MTENFSQDLDLEAIESRFDLLAGNYDDSLRRFKYFGHERLHALWVATCQGAEQPSRRGVLLELGCGTGIAGKLFAANGGFTQVVGLDLSSRMLSEAARLGIYDRLIRMEALQFLLENPDSYSTILAADFFQYVADPLSIIKAASGRLATRGVLGFTFDSHERTESIQPSEFNSLGFTFHPQAVTDWLEKSGCKLMSKQPIIDRMSWGSPSRPIPGYAVIAEKL